jgi:hypothetical protein
MEFSKRCQGVQANKFRREVESEVGDRVLVCLYEALEYRTLQQEAR